MAKPKLFPCPFCAGKPVFQISVDAMTAKGGVVEIYCSQCGVRRGEAKTPQWKRPADRLRPHLLRWRRMDQQLGEKLGIVVRHVVHRPDGRPLAGKIRTAWEGMLADAALGEGFVRHTMRHTAATWQMQAGTDPWKAAG